MGNIDFNDFQKSEFEHIATAHFETIKQVSDFFRYYLLIASAPSILIIFFGTAGLISIKNILEFHSEPYNSLMGLFFLILSMAGYFVCWYIVNQRHDAILYARTVNGIRKYFYHEGIEFDPPKDRSYRVLPKKIFQPKYFEKTLFLPVILVMALINSIYLGFGMFLLFKIPGLFWPITWGTLFSILHFSTYFGLSYYRENYYMQTHKIGIDIDGVLNKHRVHFCKILNEITQKVLDPDNIKIIPVHEDPTLNVSDLDERRVFNTVGYWENMPPIQEKFEEIEKLKKIWGFKIYIFSKRDWPEFSKIPPNELASFKEQWQDKSINDITKNWLGKYGIQYDQLVLEKGNADISDTTFSFFKKVYWSRTGKKILTQNRFQMSKKKNIRYFVDDDPIIAKKLSDICDYVFLMDQPYNRDPNYKFPPNVIRVSSWFDIFKNIRLFG
jgi:uncharacterized HAD superfamily protein